MKLDPHGVAPEVDDRSSSESSSSERGSLEANHCRSFVEDVSPTVDMFVRSLRSHISEPRVALSRVSRASAARTYSR